MICPTHNTELVYKPGGISKKTGKPYGAFYSCPSRNADGSYCSYKPPKEKTFTNGANFTQALDQSNDDKKWEKIRDEKNDNIKWLNSLNNASLIVSALLSSGKFGAEKVKESVLSLANWYYDQQPEEKSALEEPKMPDNFLL